MLHINILISYIDFDINIYVLFILEKKKIKINNADHSIVLDNLLLEETCDS